jgi:hypothetical protein
VRFIHVRDKRETKGGLTIGYVLDESNRQRAVVTVAKCSRSDAYDRKKGRLICENRFNHGTGYLVPVDPNWIEDSIVCEVKKRINAS